MKTSAGAILLLTAVAMAHRDHKGKLKAGQADEACAWSNDSEDCDDGLTCWKGACKDRDPPKIHLSFGGMAAPKPFVLPPKLELKFPGPGGKTVDCADVVAECEGPLHPHCLAAKAGSAEGRYWAKNCRKSCGLCALEESVEKKFDQWDVTQQQQQQQQQHGVAARQAQSAMPVRGMNALPQQQQQQQQQRGGGAGIYNSGGNSGAVGGGGGGGGGGGDHVALWSGVAVLVLLGLGKQAHQAGAAAAASRQETYNPVPGI